MPIRRVALCALATSLLVPLVAALPVGAEPPTENGAPKIGRLPRPAPAKGAKAGHEPNTVLVRYKAGASGAAKARALRTGNARTASTVSTARGLDVVKVRSDLPAPELLGRLRKDPAVESASLNYRRRLDATPNDYFYRVGQQRSLGTARLPLAWNLIRDASRQIVAVLDTGVDTGHPDLRGRLVTGYNAVTPGASVQDSFGHGTMVAGIVAANTNNSVGVAGATWNGRVMPVKVFRSDGYAYDEEIVRGIVFATAHGAKVINLSLGSDETSATLHAGVKHAYSHGVVVVAAAGNTYGTELHYPAAYPEVLAVGATDDAGQLADFSTYGDWVDVSAPGFDITSTWSRSAPFGDGTFGEYASAYGTSFSAPLVAGVAALVRTRIPSFTPVQVMSWLKQTARDAGPRGIDPYHGWGVVDAYHAVGGTWGPEVSLLPLGPGEPNDTPSRRIPLTSVSTTGTIATEGDADWYSYTATAAAPVRFRVTPPPFVATRSQNSDVILDIYKPDGTLALRQDWESVGLTEAVRLDVTPGTYLIKVSNFNGSRDDRAYTIAVAPGGPETPGPVGAPPLWVNEVHPVNFSTGLPVNTNLTVAFTRDVTSVNAGTVYLRNGRTGAAVPAAVSLAGRVATVNPTSPLQDNTPYRVVLSGVKDTGGTTIPAGHFSTFRTVDLAPAKVNGFAGGGLSPRAYLGWGKPNITDLNRYIVRAGTGTAWPSSPSAGIAIYSGTATSALAPALTSTVTYNLRIWVQDRAGRLSAPTDLRLAGTRFSTSYSTTTLTYGGTVRIGGKLNRTDTGALVTNRPVSLYGRQRGTSTWRKLATANTSSAGTVSFLQRPAASTDYQLRFTGTTGILGTAGGVIPVGVRPVLSIRASRTTLPLGSTVTLSGGVNPRHVGHTVYLQRLLSGRWTHVTTTRLNSSSGYGFTLRPGVRGTYAYRMVKPADIDHLLVVSATQVFRVT